MKLPLQFYFYFEGPKPETLLSISVGKFLLLCSSFASRSYGPSRAACGRRRGRTRRSADPAVTSPPVRPVDPASPLRAMQAAGRSA